MKIIILTHIYLLFSLSLQAQEEKIYDTELYRTRIAFFKTEPLQKNQIVFLGNSLTQGGKWEVYFPTEKPANRGIIGDNTEGMLARLNEIIEAQPKKLFFLGGVNDVSQDYNNKHIYNNIKDIIKQVKSGSPKTIIYIQSPLPINNDFGRYKKLTNKEKQIEELNRQIAKLCKKENVNYINLYPHFLSEESLLNPSFTNDGLHLNDVGYELWVQLIEKFVKE